MGRTDENGYLLVTSGTKGASETPLTPIANLRGRTDSNGYLLIASSFPITAPSGGAIRTGTTANNTLKLQAYDVDGAAYTDLITATASNTPTLALNSTGDMTLATGGTTRLTITSAGGAAGVEASTGIKAVGFTSTAGFLGANGYYLGYTSRSLIGSTADGTFNLLNNAGSGFDTLTLGPTTGNTAKGTLSISKVHTAVNMATATGTGTGTVTSATTALPAGSLILGVSCRVTTILAGAALGTWSVGTAGSTTAWGSGLAKDANTESNIANYAISAPFYNVSAAGIVFTASAGVFSTGVAQCTTYFVSFVNIQAV
jgi:hypothetical protein